jgi:hypothetical protein
MIQSCADIKELRSLYWVIEKVLMILTIFDVVNRVELGDIYNNNNNNILTTLAI